MSAAVVGAFLAHTSRLEGSCTKSISAKSCRLQLVQSDQQILILKAIHLG